MLPEHYPQVKAIYELGMATNNATLETKAPDWEEWDFRTADGIPLRTVHDMVFKEVSITPEPAYENAMVEISKRSVDIFLQYQQAPKSYDWRSKLHEINVIRFGQ